MIEYQIIYSKRRSIALVIRDGKLIVRAPKGVSLSEIKNVVKSHEGWIDKNLKKQAHNHLFRRAVYDLVVINLCFYGLVMYDGGGDGSGFVQADFTQKL